jgi:hypothetical protein
MDTNIEAWFGDGHLNQISKINLIMEITSLIGDGQPETNTITSFDKTRW